MPYEIIEHEGQYCLRKKDTGEMVKGSCHADKGMTEKMMRAMYANEKMSTEQVFIQDHFVTVKPGEAFRLLPLGKLVKNGTSRNITPEYAGRFRLPHFKPPIKLGSHDETTPAGGRIKSLEVRMDGEKPGLYAVPEYNEKGAQAIAEGWYLGESPEILWEGGIEDPNTGERIEGPLIVGCALLHTPHLGDAAALYSVEPFERINAMTVETVQVDKNFWEKLTARLFKEPEAPVTPPPPAVPDEFKAKFDAQAKELDTFKAKIATMEAEAAKRARIEHFAAELKATRVTEGAEMLAAMPDEQANWVVTQFKALSEQVRTSDLFGEIGSAGGGAPNPVEALHAAIQARAAEAKVDYNAAREMLAREKPDLFRI